MADSGTDGDKKDDGAGFGMKLTIAGIKQKFPSVKCLSTEALSVLLKSKSKTAGENLVIVDARAEEEYNVSHIPGAQRVDYKERVDNLMAFLPQLNSAGVQTTVVCYCSVGYRSSVVAQKIEEYLKQKDISNGSEIKVYNLEGSIFKWANESRPMQDKYDRETKFAHPYNAVFGKLLTRELRKSSL